jgi:hypothetical protein
VPGIIDCHAGRKQAVQPGALVARSEVKGVLAGRASHKPDLRQVGSRTTVGAARDAKADRIVLQAQLLQNGLKAFEKLRKRPLTFRQRQTAGRQATQDSALSRNPDRTFSEAKP